jgi:hypothetical protein
MEGERISWKLVHDIIVKMSALASNIRFYPKKMINSSFITNLGKCFETGTFILPPQGDSRLQSRRGIEV